MIFDSPPEVYSYASLNGYYAEEMYGKSPDELDDGDTGPVAHVVDYKACVVGQRGVVYIGNVRFNGKQRPDAMMFSMPGKPGLFPMFNTFDSPSSDGSPIIALASFRDTVLQFKKNSLYVINVSNPQQFFAEAVFRDCGVGNPAQVFTTSFGVIFVNDYGCFIYDGGKVVSLTSGKIDDWAGAMNNPAVGYDPRSQSIVVLEDIASNSNIDGWVYNMTTQSWSKGVSMITASRYYSNFIIDSTGYLCIHSSGSTSLYNYNADKSADTGDQTITYTTKDIDFGLPSQTKKIFKIYVTYFSDDASVPTLTYGKDGAAPTSAFDSGAFASSGGLQTTEFTVTDTDLTGIKSLSLKATGSTDHSFEIQDISILYRARPIK